MDDVGVFGDGDATEAWFRLRRGGGDGDEDARDRGSTSCVEW